VINQEKKKELLPPMTKTEMVDAVAAVLYAWRFSGKHSQCQEAAKDIVDELIVVKNLGENYQDYLTQKSMGVNINIRDKH